MNIRRRNGTRHFLKFIKKKKFEPKTQQQQQQQQQQNSWERWRKDFFSVRPRLIIVSFLSSLSLSLSHFFEETVVPAGRRNDKNKVNK